MGEIYKVAIHYGNDCGYVEYDPDRKSIRIELDHAEKTSGGRIILSATSYYS